MRTESETDAELRQRALQRLRRRREFYAHLLAYLTINGLLGRLFLAACEALC